MREPYVTPGGRISMDPAKWNVCKFSAAGFDGGYSDLGFAIIDGWGVYPPQSITPHDILPTHLEAMEKANMHAMFAVVPPESMVSMSLRDNPIEMEEDVRITDD